VGPWFDTVGMTAAGGSAAPIFAGEFQIGTGVVLGPGQPSQPARKSAYRAPCLGDISGKSSPTAAAPSSKGRTGQITKRPRAPHSISICRSWCSTRRPLAVCLPPWISRSGSRCGPAPASRCVSR
jgi:hypothetical protein